MKRLVPASSANAGGGSSMPARSGMMKGGLEEAFVSVTKLDSRPLLEAIGDAVAPLVDKSITKVVIDVLPQKLSSGRALYRFKVSTEPPGEATSAATNDRLRTTIETLGTKLDAIGRPPVPARVRIELAASSVKGCGLDPVVE